MNYTDRFNTFEKAYTRAVAEINQFLLDTDEDVRLLVNWLMANNSNPYGFLPQEWAGALTEAVGFSSLCHHLHHALVDDGEINFIVVEKTLEIQGDQVKYFTSSAEPRISFVDRWIEGYEDKVLSRMELESKTNTRDGHTVSYKINFLKDVKDFIRSHDEWEILNLKRCFITEARHDVEDAVEHYQTNPLFNPQWITEIKPKI